MTPTIAPSTKAVSIPIPLTTFDMTGVSLAGPEAPALLDRDNAISRIEDRLGGHRVWPASLVLL